MVDIGCAGSGPAYEALTAALHDIEVSVQKVAWNEIQHYDLGVVIGRAGDNGFDRVNQEIVRTAIPWIAIEIGGIGGYRFGDLDAAITGFSPGGSCFRCLQTRVESNEPPEANNFSVDRSAVRLAGAIAGRELTRQLSHGSSDLFGHTIEVPHRIRRLLPIPFCPHCDGGNPDRLITEFSDDRRDLETSLEHAEQAIDERIGIIRAVGEVDSYPAPYYLATTAETSGFSDAEAPKQAAGVHPEWNPAFMKALGEALERYCAAVYRQANFAHGTAESIDDAIHPSLFVTATSPNRDQPLEWVPGMDLRTHGRVAIPAEFVMFPPPTRHFGPAITTGLGLGSSVVDAILSGLTEVIERDATMLSWYSTFEPVKISVTNETFQDLVRRARSEGLTVTPLLVTQDIDIPVIAVTVHRSDEWPRFAIGSSAHWSGEQAAAGALNEAIQNWMELRSMGRTGADGAGAWIGEYSDRNDIGETYAALDARIAASSLDVDDSSQQKEILNQIIELVYTVGLDSYVVRLTNRDVMQLGFEVVRVLIPGAQPLFTQKPIFAERATTVPQSLGFEPRLDRAPHPYP